MAKTTKEVKELYIKEDAEMVYPEQPWIEKVKSKSIENAKQIIAGLYEEDKEYDNYKENIYEILIYYTDNSYEAIKVNG